MSDQFGLDLQAKRTQLERVLANCQDLIWRPVTDAQGTAGLLLYFDGMLDSLVLNEGALRPLLTGEGVPDWTAIPLAQAGQAASVDETVAVLLEGGAILLLEGREGALVFHTVGGVRRSPEEPSTERVVRGPREGFVENLRTNTSLVRHRIRSADLKMVRYVLGTQSRTLVMLAYVEHAARPEIIAEVRRRLEGIQVDSILDSGNVEELIEGSPWSPFPELQYTERPDTIAAQLLEGRFAIFVDGTPMVLSGPVTFWQMMQASEDYYERFGFATAIRWLRYFFMMVALYLPAVYVAVTTFHHEMVPTNLLLSIAASREGIPFPAVVEAMIMETSFEALREAGIRLPQTVGQAVSILGALVIGQATVQAGIVSAPVVIVVSLTGIASFTIPRFNTAIAIRLLRFPMMFLAGAFGLFGILHGTFLISLHLCQLDSFGVPYLTGIAPYHRRALKDILWRAPWWWQQRGRSRRWLNPR